MQDNVVTEAATGGKPRVLYPQNQAQAHERDKRYRAGASGNGHEW